MKFIKLMAVAICCPLMALCQDITGLWSGTLYNDSTRQYHQYEIGISKENGKYSGFSHTWFTIEGKKYFGVKKLKVKIASDGKVIMEDGELMVNNYPVQPSKEVKQLNVLDIKSLENELLLDGEFITNRTKRFAALTGRINLKRKNSFVQSDLVPHLRNIT
ncbi:MAG: hypothetical protein EOP53_12025, partial [Sphingobacteriales bacterium]